MKKLPFACPYFPTEAFNLGVITSHGLLTTPTEYNLPEFCSLEMFEGRLRGSPYHSPVIHSISDDDISSVVRFSRTRCVGVRENLEVNEHPLV